jgi:hypothetical protein
MEPWQRSVIAVYGALSFLVFLKGFHESKDKNNAYGLTPFLTFLGIFAWGDAVVFGLFWIASSAISLLLKDWYLFLLIISVFWVVRSLGETIYWFNQQFSAKVYDWNKPENLGWHWLFHNDSVWFIYQIRWQCVTVVSIIASVYFTNLWLKSF